MTKANEFTIETDIYIPLYSQEFQIEDILNFIQSVSNLDADNFGNLKFKRHSRCVEIANGVEKFYFSNFFIFCNDKILKKESKQWRFFLANNPKFSKTYLQNARRFFVAAKNKNLTF